MLRALANIPAYRNAFSELVSLMRHHRELIIAMTRRELTDRYAGQVLGAIWVFAHPLFLMAIYLFVFAVVFRMKIGGTYDLPRDYTTYLLSGLTAWLGCQEALVKTTTAISGQANLVKQVVFPIEVLPIRAVLSTLLTQIVSMAILLGYLLVRYQAVPWTVILIPIILGLQMLLLIGIGMALAAVGAYFRDLKDIVSVLALMNMYLMPVFYLPAYVPNIFKPVLYVNPFSYMIWCYQDAWYFGRFEHWYAWIVFPLLALFSFVLGYRLFRRLRVYLGNVL